MPTLEEASRDMSAIVVELMEILIGEEITRIVADAIEEGTALSVADAVAQIIRAYPNSGMSAGEIADEIMIEAAQAGVAVQVGRPKAA